MYIDAVPLRLRPHHALCLQYFIGVGYDDAFSRAMARVKRALDARPDRLVALVTHEDAICEACPERGGACSSCGKAARYDRETLARLNLCEGAMLPWRALRARAGALLIERGCRAEICGDCRWSDLCQGIPKQPPVCEPICRGKPFIVHILGAAGSGTSTLGKRIALDMGWQWLDVDEFYWMPVEPPFTVKRPRDERLRDLNMALDEAGSAVVSGSLCRWGDALRDRFDLVVLMRTDAALRQKRIRAREKQRFGARIEPGGDLCAAHESFVEWAMLYDTADSSIRSLRLHEAWLATCPCPTLRLDGAEDLDALAARVHTAIHEASNTSVDNQDAMSDNRNTRD